MLKIKNNDIYLNRGETHSLGFEFWNADGSPVILPPLEKYLINIARKTVTENGEFYDFYTPLKVCKYPSKAGGPVLDTELNMTVSFDDGAYVEIITYKNLVTQTRKYEVTSDSVAVDIGSTELVIGIHLTKCKLRHIKYSIGEVEETISALADSLAACAFTVRAGNYDDIVISKYMNMHCCVTNYNKTDYSVYGWNKFTTQDILEASSTTELLDKMLKNWPKGIVQVGKVGNSYYHLALYSDNTYELLPYSFRFAVPILYNDTAKLESGEYTYDVILYEGIIKDASVFASNDFPFKQPIWKSELLSPHKFVIGDSHNA